MGEADGIRSLQVNDHITAGMKATYNVLQAPTQPPGAVHDIHLFWCHQVCRCIPWG